MKHISLTIYGFDHQSGECNLQIQRICDFEDEVNEKTFTTEIDLLLAKYGKTTTPSTSDY